MNKKNTNITPSDDMRTNDFWNWFKGIAATIHSNPEDMSGTLAQELTRRVKAIHQHLSWEIGPEEDKINALTISPSGNAELLPLTQKIVSLAPGISNWVFFSAKRPKKWDYRISMTNPRGQTINLNVRNWMYYLIGYQGNSFFDLTLIPNAPIYIDKKAKIIISKLVVENIIGEELMIKWIGNVDIKYPTPLKYNKNTNEIQALDEHLRHLTD